MKILSMPYFAGGLSHLLPLYVLNHIYLKTNVEIENHFFVNNRIQNFLKARSVKCVVVDFDEIEEKSLQENPLKVKNELLSKQKQAYENVKPDLIIEDCSFVSPLIAEKNNIPRISIQRTGIFRSIDKQFRNINHMHSLHKVESKQQSEFVEMCNQSDGLRYNKSDSYYLEQYLTPKVKLIPGIPTIERLPKDIPNRESYFYSGPLVVRDKPSRNLSIRLNKFLNENKDKPVVFITTGTIDNTSIDRFINYLIKRNYAVITTCKKHNNTENGKQIFYNRLFPLNYICSISNLVIHQCGSGMYHYPIMNRVPSLTIGTKCYDREDIAQRLQQLGVSGHIPHPDDNLNYFDTFKKMVEKFENNTLADFNMIDQLRTEIFETISNFKIDQVIRYALS